MRAKEAKEISISEYLSLVGIESSNQRKSGKEL